MAGPREDAVGTIKDSLAVIHSSVTVIGLPSRDDRLVKHVSRIFEHLMRCSNLLEDLAEEP